MTGRWGALVAGLVLGTLLATSSVAGAPDTDTDADGVTDAFETTWTGTDPAAPDSDADGTPDGDEDDDLDGLTSAWEERLGLDPGAADSDLDGRDDGAEDADGDWLRNAFEARWGATDPLARDTDRDGLRDTVEDPDADELGNLGEQRFGTSPVDSDTDVDGVADGRDDADANGRRDALEQDDRPVPVDLMPSLAAVKYDLPVSYRDGCHVYSSSRTFTSCAYAATSSPTSVVLFGDSHAAQWLPALIRAGEIQRWRIVNVTRSGCPAPDVTTFNKPLGRIDVGCDTWRDEALAWLRREQPDVIVVTSLDSYNLYDERGDEITAPARLAARWRAGLRRTLEAMPPASRVILLADTPYPIHSVPKCLEANPDAISACQRPRRQMVDRRHIALEQDIADAVGVAYADLSPVICPYDPCPLVVGDLLVYRDWSHINATYAAVLAPAVVAMVDGLLDGTGDLPGQSASPSPGDSPSPGASAPPSVSSSPSVGAPPSVNPLPGAGTRPAG